MDVKEAVKIAKEHFINIFGSEPMDNIALEEVVFNDDENVWEVTIGFSRPWDRSNNLSPLASLSQGPPIRNYRVVKIDDQNGTVKSIKIRDA